MAPLVRPASEAIYPSSAPSYPSRTKIVSAERSSRSLVSLVLRSFLLSICSHLLLRQDQSNDHVHIKVSSKSVLKFFHIRLQIRARSLYQWPRPGTGTRRLAATHIDPGIKQRTAELLIGLEKVTDERA